MCMFSVLGRLLEGDPVFLEWFTANPLEASWQLGASPAQAQGFVAIGSNGIGQIIEQMASIRSALGPELTKLIAGDFGVQMLMGHALADSRFASRLQKDGEALTTKILGKGKSAANAAAIAKSAEFARLKGFAAQRRAMSGISTDFYFKSAKEGINTELRELAERTWEKFRAELKEI